MFTNHARVALPLAAVPVLALAAAAETPPADGKPVSEIIASVEEANDGAAITSIEFDEGLWEVDLVEEGAGVKVYLDPRSGEEVRRGADDPEDERPPADGKKLSEILASLEEKDLGTICEVEFDDRYWEVEVKKDGRERTIRVDPKTGEPRSSPRAMGSGQ